MKILFLYPYPHGESPSQRFRFEQYYNILRQNGYRIKGQSFWGRKTWHILYKKGHTARKAMALLIGFLKRLTILPAASKASFVFIHRECTPVGPPVFEWIIAKILRKKIIYDFDDAIWLPNTSSENKLVAIIKWHSKFNSICRWCYLISCGNDWLASIARAFNSNVVVNPTTIDTEHHHNPALYHVKKDENIITIGWTGTHSTLKYLDAILPLIRKLEERHNNLRFLVISNKKPWFQLRSLVFMPWSKETEIQDLLTIDIGLMPLVNDTWALGKCGFKALQYMALNIPAVASPAGVNKRIIDHGVNGFLCDSEEDWFSCLDKLVQEPDLRKQIGGEGRKKVISDYSISSNKKRFLSLFK